MYLHPEWGIQLHKSENCVMFLLTHSLLNFFLNNLLELLLSLCKDLQSTVSCATHVSVNMIFVMDIKLSYPALLFTLFDGAVLMSFAISFLRLQQIVNIVCCSFIIFVLKGLLHSIYSICPVDNIVYAL